uniref:Partner of Y14 and mago n=1 Tax=Parascaris univalens TaxID=6257 RepID=A0A915CCU0_PARUN
TKSGETFIAASQRADGTWRKARRVKEGYVPQEEQPRYESPAAQVSRDSKYPIGMTPKETTPHKVSTIMSFGEYSNKFKLRDAIKLQKLRFCGAKKLPSEPLLEHKLPFSRANKLAT